MVTSLAERCIRGEVDGFRRDHCYTGIERRLAQPRLHHGFRLGELRLGVDAAYFILAGLDHDGLQSQISHDADGIGQIILALAVGVADLLDDRERLAAVERHHAGIAQRDLAFRRTRVGLLADRGQPAALDHQPAVTGRIGGVEAEHGERRAVLQRRAHALEGLGRDQRRIAERDQKIVRAAGNRVAGREHRVRGAEALALNEGGRIGPDPRDLVRDRLVVGPDHHGKRGAGAMGRGIQHMRQQRLAGDRMQHLWQR